jgi:hypothetical protein
LPYPAAHLRPYTRRVLAAGALTIALALTATAASAAAEPVASFSIDPEAPVAGQAVEFTDTSTGFSDGVPLQRDWDLDGDGAYDDASGPTATRSYSAGSHEIALRVRQEGAAVVERVARRTLYVLPGTAPTPTPTPPPPPTNQPPKAVLALDCHKVGGMFVFCPGALARIGQSHTFDASASSDPDGSIVRYQWDLDGNGSFERDTGADATTAYTYPELLFRGRDSLTVHVRVTDNRGATAERAYAIRLLAPGCLDEVAIGALSVRGECFRKHKLLDKVSYVSDPGLPASVNGIAITPHAGKRIEVLVRDGKPRVQGNGVVTVPVHGVQTRLVDGSFSWGVAGDRLTGFAPDGDARMNGLRVTGVPAQPQLVGPTSSKVWFHVALPSTLGGSTSDDPILARPGAAGASGPQDALEFEVANASLGIIELKDLRVAFDGEDLWEISASMRLPEPMPWTVSADAGIRNGDFEHAGAAVDFGTPGIGPLGPVYIQRISFRVEVNPKKSQCVRHIGVVHSDDLPAQQELKQQLGIDIPRRDVRLRQAGLRALRRDRSDGRADGARRGGAAARCRPGLRHVPGPPCRAAGPWAAVRRRDPVGRGRLHARHGRLCAGQLEVPLRMGRRRARRRLPELRDARAQVQRAGPCEGMRGLRRLVRGSRRPAVLARRRRVPEHRPGRLADWSPGFGYLWGDTFPDLYFSGCDVGEYREHINHNGSASASRAHAAGFEQSVDLPAGLPGAVIAVEGRDAPPQVTLIGPHGEQVTAPRGLHPLLRKPYLVLKDPRRNVTQFAVGEPAAGRWRIRVEPGSSPVTSIKSANGLSRPKVRARVVGSGHRRQIAYRVHARAGQKVTFVERGATGGTVIGTARGDAGRIAFRPGAGKRERRRIVAIVEQDGYVRDELGVASYRAPGPERPRRVRGLKVRRRGSSLRLRWRPVAAAVRYQVGVRLNDGRRLSLRTSRTRARVPHVTRRVRGAVTVRGIGREGASGRPSRRPLRRAA